MLQRPVVTFAPEYEPMKIFLLPVVKSSPAPCPTKTVLENVELPSEPHPAFDPRITLLPPVVLYLFEHLPIATLLLEVVFDLPVRSPISMLPEAASRL